MPERADYVVAECPLCPWRSAEVSLRDEVNAEWHARQEAAKQYRSHFDQHRPLPRFLRVTESGPSLSDGTPTIPCASVGPGRG